MACNVILYNMLGEPKQTGGSWKLFSGGPAVLSVNGAPEATFANGNTIPGGHNISIGFNGTTAGEYVFEYTVGTVPCVDTSRVTVEVLPAAKAGRDRILTFCNSDVNSYNLFNLVQNGNGLGGGGPLENVDNTGVWSGSGTTSSAYSAGNVQTPTDNTFRPNLVLFPSGATEQVFTFIYTVTKPNTSPDCTNCTDTAEIEITVTLQPNAGLDASITVCNAL